MTIGDLKNAYITHNDEKYCGKKLFIENKKRINFVFHKIKTKTYYLQEGMIEILYYTDSAIDEKLLVLNLPVDEIKHLSSINKVLLQAGESFEIPVGMRHSIKALYANTTVYEFSTQHLDDDSYRIVLPI